MKPAHIIARIPQTASAGIISILTLTGCNTPSATTEQGSATGVQSDSYHADLDIAMTVRSLVDAIQVGEPLTADDYDFKGVFTDGIGTPLYTDLQGAPGQWEVDVTTPTSASIRNLHLGDLLGDDLREYLAANLNLDDTRIVELTEADLGPEMVTYDFGAGYLRFTMRDSISESGHEGIMLDIDLEAKNS